MNSKEGVTARVARAILRLAKPNRWSMSCGMDDTPEASVQHCSLKAEQPGETEASKPQSDEKHADKQLL